MVHYILSEESLRAMTACITGGPDVFCDLHTCPGGGGVLDISLGGEVRRGPSYPDPV